MFCPRLSENFSFSFYLFKKGKKEKKEKSLHKYCPAATRPAFSPKFILEVKVQNSIF